MMTVKSRQGKAQLLVKALKNESLFECNCTIYKSLGVHWDTIAVANNLTYIHTYINTHARNARAHTHTHTSSVMNNYVNIKMNCEEK